MLFRSIDANLAYEQVSKNHFLVVTRKERCKPLRFITAYYMNSKIELFKHLERATPVSIELQECMRQVNQQVKQQGLTKP